MMLKTHKLIFIFFEFIKKKLNLIQILSSSTGYPSLAGSIRNLYFTNLKSGQSLKSTPEQVSCP